MSEPNVCYSFHDLGNPAEIEGKSDSNPWVVIICPKCDDHLTATRAQYEGRVSLHHDAAYCGYHETHDLRGRRPSTSPCRSMRN